MAFAASEPRKENPRQHFGIRLYRTSGLAHLPQLKNDKAVISGICD
jgi:hypothetical protein